MSFTGRAIHNFQQEATTLAPTDLFGVDVDAGGGTYITKKVQRKVLPDLVLYTKPTDTTRSNTPADDSDLVFTAASGATYLIRAHLVFVPTLAGQASVVWTLPATTSAFRDELIFQTPADTWTHAYDTTLFTGFVGTAANTVIIDDHVTIVPSATGTVAVNWSSAVVNNVTLKAGSYLQVQRITP
jgi:hypothetical protein